jgi:hypothetical protein
MIWRWTSKCRAINRMSNFLTYCLTYSLYSLPNLRGWPVRPMASTQHLRRAVRGGQFGEAQLCYNTDITVQPNEGRHFVMSIFCHVDILSCRHFVMPTFCHVDILSCRHFVMSILTFCHVVILSCWHFDSQHVGSWHFYGWHFDGLRHFDGRHFGYRHQNEAPIFYQRRID